MPTLTIRHVTAYRYRQPVAFGEHRMMLHPRAASNQRVLEASIEISPEPKAHASFRTFAPATFRIVNNTRLKGAQALRMKISIPILGRQSLLARLLISTGFEAGKSVSRKSAILRFLDNIWAWLLTWTDNPRAIVGWRFNERAPSFGCLAQMSRIVWGRRHDRARPGKCPGF